MGYGGFDHNAPRFPLLAVRAAGAGQAEGPDKAAEE